MAKQTNQFIYLGSDHGGFELKEFVKDALMKHDYQVRDLGALKYDSADDYPKYGIKVARAVQKDPLARGIVFCRSGAGMSIITNKFKGVRTALVWTPALARAASNDDHANVISIPSDYINQGQTLQVIEAWLNTKFSKSARHVRCVKQVNRYGS